MKRVALTLLSTVTGLVLLLGFKTHAAGSTAPRPAAIAPQTTNGTASPTGSTSTSSTTGTGTKTVTGDAGQTRYGPVQVQVTVTNGRVTAATAVDYPQSEPRDQQINAYAIPVLNQEAVAAGTASIDMVSGATFTSEGYISSLQSALDKAGS